MARLLSQSQFARRKKVDRSTVCKWIKEGKIKLINGKIDPGEAEKQLAANVIPRRIDSTRSKRKHRKRISAQDSTSDGTLLTLTDARRQTEFLKGQLLSHKLQVQRGDLIRKDESLNWLMGHITVAKMAFMTFPQRMASVLAGVTNEKEIHLILKNEIWKILKELARPLTEEQKKGVLDENDFEQKPNEETSKVEISDSLRLGSLGIPVVPKEKQKGGDDLWQA